MGIDNSEGSVHAEGGKRMSDLKVCNRCQYAWFSNVDSPVRCPSCGSHCWDKPVVPNECQICGHTWFPRTSGTPLRCPSCKTRSWNMGFSDSHTRATRPTKETATAESVMERYLSGKGCVKISMETGIPLSTVFRIVKSRVGKAEVVM